MTDAQIFQVIGLAYAAMGLRGLLSKDSFKRLMEDFVNSPAVLFLTGILTLVFGFVLVVFHNVWVMGWPVVITVFGWIALFKGIWIIAFPGFYEYISGKMRMTTPLMRGYAAVVLLIGIFFLLLGFGVV